MLLALRTEPLRPFWCGGVAVRLRRSHHLVLIAGPSQAGCRRHEPQGSKRARAAGGSIPQDLPRPAAPEEGTGARLARGARRGRDYLLNGSFTTTLTPAMTPVAVFRTWSTASWLISPAPLRAPVAAADAASSAPRPTCLAPAMAPSTAFRATTPMSPPTSAVLLTRTRALALTVSTASTPTSLVPLRTPMTPPLAVAPRSPPTWAVPVMAPRSTSDTVEVRAVPTAPVPLMVVTSVPLTVSTTVFMISPVPLIEPTTWSFTDSMIPLCVVISDLLPGDACIVGAGRLVRPVSGRFVRSHALPAGDLRAPESAHGALK